MCLLLFTFWIPTSVETSTGNCVYLIQATKFICMISGIDVNSFCAAGSGFRWIAHARVYRSQQIGALADM